MNQRPITEDDLHGYVDQALLPERRAEVASYLDDHPEVAKRIAGFADQRRLLRAALAPIAEEPVPAELNLSRMIERRTRPWPVRWAVAAVLLLSIGGALRLGLERIAAAGTGRARGAGAGGIRQFRRLRARPCAAGRAARDRQGRTGGMDLGPAASDGQGAGPRPV